MRIDNGEYFEIDEFSNVVDNLEVGLKFLKSNHSYKMKWVTISLFQALYGLFLCALQGTDPRQTIIDKKDDRGKTITLYANGVEISILARVFGKTESQIKEWLGQPKIISFDQAFFRIQKQEYLPPIENVKPLCLTPEEIGHIDLLCKGFRNEFEHFSPKGWVIENSLFWPIIETAIKIFRFIILQSNCLVFSSLDEPKILDVLKEIEIIVTKNMNFFENEQTYAISPIHTTKSFSGPLTIDQKIEIFVARVKGWQIQPAIDLKNEGINNSDFAKLSIIISYFEMIGKYYEGYTGDWESTKHFKKGLLITFPEIPDNEEIMLETLYQRVRNGLYHLGITKQKVILVDRINGSFGYHVETGTLAICPDKFVNDISIKFNEYAQQLQNQNNTRLRENFEKRFNYDNNIVDQNSFES